MAICKDRAIRTLNKLGYDVVRFPRADVSPLDVIVASSGSFSRLSHLPQLWQSTEVVPQVNEVQAADIANIESTEMNGSLGISAIMDFFSRADVGAAAKRAKTIRFVAIEPVIMTCDHGEIENYVSNGDVNLESAASRHFLDDSVRTYVIIEVIASKKLQIVVGGETTAQAQAAAADISGAISAEIEVGTAHSASNIITYEREDLATFGFKSAEIYFDESWLVDLPRTPGKAFLGRKELPDTLLAPDSRVLLSDIQI